jgi:ABC-type nitrate/sulfonate/bicarbonate transport system ATPase subunit
MNASYELRQKVLEVSDVCLQFGARPILDHVNATVRDVVRPGVVQGQVVAVLGPSGIGKTQLFRVMAGLQRPDRGKVLVGPDQKLAEQASVGVVAQNYPLFEHYTVLQNLVVAGRCAGLSRAVATDRARALLERFRLREHESSFPVILSGGQRQRAAIAQQLLCSRQLLLMDEPFSGLDPSMVREVCRLILEVSHVDELFTVVIVTHDIDAALAVADTIWLLGQPAGVGETRGATILREVDLKERGLAWREDSRSLPAFVEARREVEAVFACKSSAC